MYKKFFCSSSTLSTLVVAAFMITAATVVSSCKKDKDNDPASFTVTFDPDGGVPKPADQTVAQGGKATVPSPEPTKADFAFGGWYNGAEQWDFDKPITADLTLKANWTAQQPDAPTVTLTPASVTISNATTTQTVTVGGTATGEVTLNDASLPDGVTATASGATITVTGVRPTTNVPPIEGSFTVAVTREDVTQNLTVVVNLTTTWTAPTLPTSAGLYLGAPESLTAESTRIGTVAQNNLEAAVSHISTAGEYTLLLSDDDLTVSAIQVLNVSNAKLTIIGLGSERKISRSSIGRIFTVGASEQTGIELTLGANITLQGRTTAHNSMLVNVQNGAAFTMLNGSKITGNNSPSPTATTGAAVVVNGSTFTMKGGTITENNSTGNTGNINPGGLYAHSASTVILEGGSIEGNTGVAGDVLFEAGVDFTLSGNARIGTLTLNATNATTRATLNIGGLTGTGTVLTLNLRGNDANMNTVRGYWVNGSAILGGNVNTTTVGRITLGDFISTAAKQAISNTHYINASGVLVEN